MNSKERFHLIIVLLISSVSLPKFYELAGWYGVALSAFVIINVAVISYFTGMSVGYRETAVENANSIRRKGKQKT